MLSTYKKVGYLRHNRNGTMLAQVLFDRSNAILPSRGPLIWTTTCKNRYSARLCSIGPLLFLIYINDLPQCLQRTSASMFADDTQVDTSSENINIIVENLNHDLEKVSTWMSANQLTLNHILKRNT